MIMWNKYIDVSIVVDKYYVFIYSISVVILLGGFKCGKYKFIFCLCFDFDVSRIFLKVMLEGYFSGRRIGCYWCLIIYVVRC